jgi:hypothetical protein
MCIAVLVCADLVLGAYPRKTPIGQIVQNSPLVSWIGERVERRTAHLVLVFMGCRT